MTESTYKANGNVAVQAAAFERLEPDMAELFETEDGNEGLQSFIERREARFVGR